MKWVMIVVRAFLLTGRLSALLPQLFFIKRAARRKFSAELARIGLTPEQVKALSDAYSEMVHLNPAVYLSHRSK